MIKTLELKDLECAGCAATIRTALKMHGFTSVKVNLLQKPHSVSAEIKDNNHFDLLKKILRDHDYCLLTDS